MHTALIRHRDCLLHDMGQHHPESPDRLHAVEDQLIASGLIGYLLECEAPVVTREQLARVHSEDYLEALDASVPARGLVHLDPDTAMNPNSLDAARRAAGAVVHATDLVLRAEAGNAFCCVRPPGHHAERSRAMGFCFFNNVAVGVAHALEQYGLKRVVVADFDVHHGNGTEDIFRHDPRVLMVSTFQHLFYLYSGVEGRSERMVNIPLPVYTSGQGFREAVQTWWLPALERFQPEMVFISAGFDAHREDDMASLALVEADYAWVTEQLKTVADRHAQGRIVSVLEGGYALSALGRGVVAHLRVLADL
jgi:acetoin utilization deacetylase AcuC-like enzyme